MKKILFFLSCLLLLQNCNGQIKKEQDLPKDKASNPLPKQEKAKNYFQLENVTCKHDESDNGFYTLNCDDNFTISNSIIKSDEKNHIEFITLKFNDIDKAIIRNINTTELISSKPSVYKNKKENSYMFLFPLVGEYNFGWLIYYYKDYKLYFIGKRVTYWQSENEETKTSYQQFTKIYQNKNSLIVEMPMKNIIGIDSEYSNYPKYSDGIMSQKGEDYIFEFKLNNLTSYKLYNDGCYEGDYNKMIINNIIKPIE